MTLLIKMQSCKVILYVSHCMYLSLHVKADTVPPAQTKSTDYIKEIIGEGKNERRFKIDDNALFSTKRRWSFNHEEGLRNKFFKNMKNYTQPKLYINSKRFKRDTAEEPNFRLINLMQPTFITEREFKKIIDYFKKLAIKRSG